MVRRDIAVKSQIKLPFGVHYSIQKGISIMVRLCCQAQIRQYVYQTMIHRKKRLKEYKIMKEADMRF